MSAFAKMGTFVSTREEPTGTQWIEEYWKAIHIIARCYEPESDNKKQAILNFYKNLANIVPSQSLSQTMNKFIKMYPDVIKTLKDSTTGSSFFTVYPYILNILEVNPQSFMSYCTASSDLLFAWTYLLHTYWAIETGNTEIPFASLNIVCDKNTITKNTWALPVWYVLHSSAYYAPSLLNQTWSSSFKAFIYTFEYALPCSICRKHIKENLKELPIDPYLVTNKTAFQYTWTLHNIVNKMLDKPVITLAEAEYIYAPQKRQYAQHNAMMRGGYHHN